MSFPIYRHDMPWDDWRDSRARQGSKKNVESLGSERPSIWKRELSLGRKKDQPADVVAQAAEPEETTPALDETPTERTSIWKRELSFGRKKNAGDGELDQPSLSDAEPVSVDEEPEAPSADKGPSIWKRELSFGRKNKDEHVEPESFEPESFEPETFEHESVVEAEPVVETEQHEVTPPAVPEPVAEQPVDSWRVPGWEPVDAPLPESAPEPTSEPAAAAPAPAYDFTPADPEPFTFEPQPEPVAFTPNDDLPTPVEPEPAPFAFEPEPDREPELQSFVDVEPELDETPAPADERPSIWKRDLSFGGKSKKPKGHKGSDWEFDAVADSAAASETGETDTVEWPTVESELGTDVEPATDEQVGGRKKRRTKEKKQKQPRVKASKGSRGGKKIVGLRVGASQIAAAHVQTNGHHELLKMARMPLDRGVVVAGELRDPEALSAALRVFFKQNKLPKQGIRLGIASNRVGVRVLEVTGVEDLKLLGNAVRFRAQEVLPIPLSEAVLDYRVLRERTEEDGTVTREVLVAFAYRELVDRYTSVCRSAGLRLIGIDLDGFALLRALVDPADPDDRLNGAAVVTVALGHDRSIMSVTDGTICEFTRVIEWGGAALDTAVARILALTPSQAEPIKRELTLDRYAETPDELSDDQATRARAAMVQEVHTFAREFVSSLQFYQAQPGSLDIGEIVVTGGTAHMPGLVEQLQELIGVAVRIGDPLSRVRLSKGVATDEPVGSLALAIGLGIED